MNQSYPSAMVYLIYHLTVVINSAKCLCQKEPTCFSILKYFIIHRKPTPHFQQTPSYKKQVFCTFISPPHFPSNSRRRCHHQPPQPLTETVTVKCTVSHKLFLILIRKLKSSGVFSANDLLLG